MFAPHEPIAKRAWLAGLGTLLLALLATPASSQQKPSGAEVWAANCGRCHRPRAVDAYDARQWESVVTHMALTARLTPDETQAVREFLVGAARAREGRRGGAAAARANREPVLVATTGAAFSVPRDPPCCEVVAGRSVYTAQCVACHGQRGTGDGPAAVALNPRPANLTNEARMAQLSDDSLVQIISNGRNGMPGFEQILTPQQVREVVFYLRTLKP